MAARARNISSVEQEFQARAHGTTAVDRGADSVVFVTNVLNGTVAANGAVVNRCTVSGRHSKCDIVRVSGPKG